MNFLIFCFFFQVLSFLNPAVRAGHHEVRYAVDAVTSLQSGCEFLSYLGPDSSLLSHTFVVEDVFRNDTLFPKCSFASVFVEEKEVKEGRGKTATVRTEKVFKVRCNACRNVKASSKKQCCHFTMELQNRLEEAARSKDLGVIEAVESVAADGTRRTRLEELVLPFHRIKKSPFCTRFSDNDRAKEQAFKQLVLSNRPVLPRDARFTTGNPMCKGMVLSESFVLRAFKEGEKCKRAGCTGDVCESMAYEFEAHFPSFTGWYEGVNGRCSNCSCEYLVDLGAAGFEFIGVREENVEASFEKKQTLMVAHISVLNLWVEMRNKTRTSDSSFCSVMGDFRSAAGFRYTFSEHSMSDDMGRIGEVVETEVDPAPFADDYHWGKCIVICFRYHPSLHNIFLSRGSFFFFFTPIFFSTFFQTQL